MLFGEDYTVNKITISQPTIGDILFFGEEDFYRALSPFLYNATSIRLFLWEHNIDWNKVKDIEVFSYLMPSMSVEYKDILSLVFKKISFEDFQLYKKDKDDKQQEFMLYSKSQNILLTEDEYMEIA